MRHVLFCAATLLGAALPAGAQVQLEKLVAGDGGSKDFFGTSVSVWGDRALVGATGYVPLPGGNCAYVIERQADGTWAQTARLNSSAHNVYYLGASVSLWGDRAAVGAPETVTGKFSNGSAHVFEHQPSGEWIEVAGIYPSNDAISYFGQSVSLWGDRLLVGEPGPGDGSSYGAGDSGGLVRMFERQPSGAWTEVFTAWSPIPDAEMGKSVSIFGDVAVAGAPGDHFVDYTYRDPPVHFDVPGMFGSPDSVKPDGSVRVFNRGPDGHWSEGPRLTSGHRVGAGRFGSAVSVSDRYLVVGAPDDDGLLPQSGAVYIFERQPGGTWKRAARLVAGDGASGDAFGSSVSLSGQRALIGAVKSDAAGADAGSVYAFERQPNGKWIQIAEFTAPDGAAGDAFGCSVAIAGDHALVGAQGDDDLGDGSGAAWVIDVH